MPLRDTLNRLVALQSLSADIARHNGDKDALHKDVEKQRELAEELAKRREEAKKERQQSQKAADALELRMKEAEEQNARLQVQLNTTKHQREYDAILKSMLSNRADVSKWEDEALEHLQRTDELKRQEAETEKRLAAERENLQQIQQHVVRQVSDYERRVGELELRRQKLRDSVNTEILRSYERIARSRGNTAVVKVRSRVCQGCFTSLPKQLENELMRGAQIIYCHNCGRILMLDEEQ